MLKFVPLHIPSSFKPYSFIVALFYLLSHHLCSFQQHNTLPAFAHSTVLVDFRCAVKFLSLSSNAGQEQVPHPRSQETFQSFGDLVLGRDEKSVFDLDGDRMPLQIAKSEWLPACAASRRKTLDTIVSVAMRLSI
jgi:hypothetical protein